MVKMAAGGHWANCRLRNGRRGGQAVAFVVVPACVAGPQRKRASWAPRVPHGPPCPLGLPIPHHTPLGKMEPTFWVLLLTSALIHRAWCHQPPNMTRASHSDNGKAASPPSPQI